MSQDSEVYIEDDEPDDGFDMERFDFVHEFMKWRKLDEFEDNWERKAAKKHTLAGQRVDPYTVHCAILNSAEGYNGCNKDANVEALFKEVLGKKPEVNQKHSFMRYLKLLWKFQEHLSNNKQAVNKLENGEGTLAERAIETLTDHAKTLEQLKNIPKRKTFVDPRVSMAIQNIQSMINTAVDELNTLTTDSSTDRRVILWLGQNGIGKTFCLNLLLMLSERPSWYYSREGGVFEAIERYSIRNMPEGGEIKAQEVVQENEDGENEGEEVVEKIVKVNRSNLLDELKNISQFDTALVVVEPNEGDFKQELDSWRTGNLPSKEEITLEKEYMSAIKQRAFSFSEWADFTEARGNAIPGYILTSSVQLSHRSTTAMTTNIRLGRKWHFEVVYLTLKELEDTLRSYPFRDNYLKSTEAKKGKQTSGDWTHEMQLKFETMVYLLHTTVEQRSCQTTKGHEEGVDDGGSDDDIDLDDTTSQGDLQFPQPGIPMTFKDEIKRIAGRRLVFVGKGSDALHDRVYLRRMLHAILFQGLSSPFAAPPGTSEEADVVKNVPVGPDEVATSIPERMIIKAVNVYAPSALLEEDVEWQDAPGTNDADPLKMTQLFSALDDCDGLMTFSERTNDELVLNLFQSKIVPRIWQNDFDSHRFGNFLLAEKSYVKTVASLARDSSQQNAASIRSIRRDTMMPYYNRLTDYSHGSTIEHIEFVKQKFKKSLNLGTWPIFPLMYTSLLFNIDGWTNFETLARTEPKKDTRTCFKEALGGTHGRNLIVTLMHVSQSSTRAILSGLKQQVKLELNRLRAIATSEKQQFTVPPSCVLLIAERTRQSNRKAGKKVKDGSPFFQDSSNSRKRPRTQSGGEELISFEARLEQKKRSILEHISESRIDCAPLLGIENFRHSVIERLNEYIEPTLRSEGYLKAQRFNELEATYHIQAKVLDQVQLISFDRIFEEYQRHQKRLQEAFEHEATDWLEFVFCGQSPDKDTKGWIRYHLQRFMSTSIPVRLQQAGVTLPEHSEFSQDLRHRCKKQAKAVYKKVMAFEKEVTAQTGKFKGNNDKKLEVFLEIFRRKIYEFTEKVREDLLLMLNSHFKRKDMSMEQKLVLQRPSALDLLTSQMADYIFGFTNIQDNNVRAVDEIASTVGFVSNRIEELIGKDGLLELDGYSFESWIKVKIILEDFVETNRAFHSNCDRWLSGRNLSAHSKRKITLALDGKIPRNRLHENIGSVSALNRSTVNRKLDPGTEVEFNVGGSKYVPCEVELDGGDLVHCKFQQYEDLGMGALYQFLLDDPNVAGSTNVQNLASAVMNCVGLPETLKENMITIWIRLIEAIYPDTSLGKAAERKESTGSQEETLVCNSTMFNALFEDLPLESFLRDITARGNSDSKDNKHQVKLAVALLLGVVEMFATSFVVQVTGDDGLDMCFSILPRFRFTQNREDAFFLKWSRQKGFAA